MTRKQREIMMHWEIAHNDFPEDSTEFVIAIVCDRYGCEYSDVIGALSAENRREERE